MATEGDYRRLFEQTHDAVIISSRDGRVIDANPAAGKLYGLDREELIGARSLEFWCDPAEREDFQARVEERGHVRDFRAYQERADVTQMEVLINAVVRRDDEGRVIGYLGILRDVSEGVRTRRELEASRERIRTAQQEREPQEPAEVRIVQMDGTVVHVEVRGIPIQYEGEPGVQTLARDVTEEVRLRARLQDMAYYDGLTGLANRRLLREKAEQALQAEASASPSIRTRPRTSRP